MTEFSKPITKGNITTLIRISIPLMFFLFCEALTGFCERIFLSYDSIASVTISLNATYLEAIFQSPCLVIGAMAQVFVGFYQGRGELERIGSCVWQLIWFSFLSFLITLPLSYITASWYFKGSVIEKAGIDYFMILAWGNFLIPLSTSLSCFYLGRGKTLLVTSLMLGTYALNLLLSWMLIFGIEGILSPLGVKGAAYGKCISLALLCLVFFGTFLAKRNRELYRTDLWHFSPIALWHYIQPGLVRAFGYFSAKAWWAVICYIMIKKDGIYLDVLTIGGTISALLIFIATGNYRAVLTISSNLLGREKNTEIWRLCRSFTLYITGIAILLILPLIIFPDTLLCFFDPSSKAVFKETFSSISQWVWLYLFALTMQMGFCAILVTLQELKFQLYCYLFLWPFSAVIVYFGIIKGGWHASTLWLIMALESIVVMIVFLVRLQQIKGAKETPLPSLGEALGVAQEK